MKKILSVTLVVVIICFAFVATAEPSDFAGLWKRQALYNEGKQFDCIVYLFGYDPNQTIWNCTYYDFHTRNTGDGKVECSVLDPVVGNWMQNQDDAIATFNDGKVVIMCSINDDGTMNFVSTSGKVKVLQKVW